MRSLRLGAACALAALPFTAAPAAAAVPHTVTSGETLWSIAAANGFTTNALAAYNGLSADSQVILGATIQIPSEAEAAAALGGAGAATSSTTAPTTATAETAAAVAPASTSTPSTQAGSGTAPVAAQAPAPGLGGGDEPHPTNERVTGAQIGETAASHDVEPAHAQGVAWQESGFNNAVVSPVGARGVMQIMPPTWEWIQDNLAGYRLSPDSAAENVHAGVMYMNYLRRMTGDERMATAAYYQGLSSVRENGLFPETEQYVESVMAQRARFAAP